jgi:hypothetical protein
LKHVEELVSQLSDHELKQLVFKSGIKFMDDDFDRDLYEGVIDEIDRKDFYKAYSQLLAARG